MLNKRSLYWLLRAQEDEKRMQRICDGAMKEVRQMYRRQYLKIVKELEGLKAQLDNGKELSRTQLWNYSRWRQLEKELVVFVDEAYRISNAETTKALEEVFERTIGKKAGSFDDTRLTMPVTAHQVIGTTWSGERYSSRIWKNQAAIADRLKHSMEDMLVQGKGLPEIKKAIMNEFKVAFDYADRLVRTEAAYVLNKANVQKYRQEGVKKIVWDTGLEDGNECAICKARSNKVYLIGEAPIIPAHPRCRCIYSAVVEIGDENVKVDGPEAEEKILLIQSSKSQRKKFN
jgi:SPP1 gp7 family putative phage head morphogenesis protein